MSSRILVTGGAGYIGSHTCLELLRAGHEVHVIDNLSNGSLEAIERVQRLANRVLGFTECDVRDSKAVKDTFIHFEPEAVLHFAGLKVIQESFQIPSHYYDVNVGGTAVLISEMERVSCKRIVFSSSATVYGEPQYLPCDEKHPLNPNNPYGRTKLMSETLLSDWVGVGQGRRAIALRYFNPVGADVSGVIGEDSLRASNNLMPFIAQVALGLREYLEVYGNDYDTIDGTGVRDYIHVCDLALAHVAAVNQIDRLNSFEVFNIGTGNGVSVLQMVQEFEKQSGQSIKLQFAPRRPGDAPAVWANVSKAFEKIGFEAKRGVAEICSDTWHWQSANPFGYRQNFKSA